MFILLVDISHQLVPVADGHNNVARVNKIKSIFWVEPRALDVVDHEFDIWRHPHGLYRAEVDSKYTGTGVLVPH
jgi:hypothetical protein